MKKLLLIALFSVLGFAVQASTWVQVNPAFPNPCAGTIVIKFVAYQHGTCTPVATSLPITVTSPGPSFKIDLDDPATWGGPIPSYLCFGVEICMDCTPLIPNFSCMTIGDVCCFAQTGTISTAPCCPAGLVINGQWIIGGSGGIAHSVNIF